MPTEIRRLIFSNPEMCTVLTQFLCSSRTTVEPGTVVDTEVRVREPLSVVCRVQGRSGRQTAEQYDATFVCAAIISWCMENKVPLAKKAKKAVHVTSDGRLALDVTLASF